MGLGSTRKTVLVTGAAGFLGSHLVDRLLAHGFEVIGLDNLMTGDLANLKEAGGNPHFHFEVGDVRYSPLPYAEIIYNLACPASPVHYQADPHATFTSSVLGALRLVEHVRQQKGVRIFHASTSEVYGDPLVHPQQEGYWGHVNPVGVRACYDEGKRAAETVFIDAYRAGLDVRIARIFNTYGPRMALNDGRVVSNFLRQAISNLPIVIYGKGRQTRSFCHQKDLVDGILRLTHLDRSAFANNGFDYPIVNLGNPVEHSIAQLASLVMEVTGAAAGVMYDALPADDPRQRCPDISRAQVLIDFSPTVSIERGLLDTYRDFAQRLAPT